MKRLTLALVVACAGCGTGQGDGPVQRVVVPVGAPFSVVADSLAAKDLVGAQALFRLYARVTGAADDVKAGTYEFREGVAWRRLLGDLVAGRVAVDRLTIPEGWDIRRIAPRLAQLTGRASDSLFAYMLDTATAARFGVPGPTLEGYLYPATYVVPAGSDPDTVISRMVREYQKIWTPERRALADSLGMSEREVAALASIVEKEAKIADEMPRIAAVYHNRLEIGYPLQADPTVQYALGAHQTRLLYVHIDSAGENPYNTYRYPGLPPGPIGSPSVRAIDAVLRPENVDYLYFVARDDGSHVFTRHLEQHNAAKAQLQRQRRAVRDSIRRDSIRAANSRS